MLNIVSEFGEKKNSFFICEEKKKRALECINMRKIFLFSVKWVRNIDFE